MERHLHLALTVVQRRYAFGIRRGSPGIDLVLVRNREPRTEAIEQAKRLVLIKALEQRRAQTIHPGFERRCDARLQRLETLAAQLRRPAVDRELESRQCRLRKREVTVDGLTLVGIHQQLLDSFTSPQVVLVSGQVDEA